MKSAIISTLTLAGLLILLAGCKAQNPGLTGRPPHRPPTQWAPEKPDPTPFDKQFTFSPSEFTATQARYDENQISVLLTVNKDGQSVNDLKDKDFSVTENGVRVSPFTLASDVKRQDQVTDIAFVVDITGSMGPFLESAKLRLKNFIVNSRAKGYHIRMCLSTFGDFVVVKCDRFFDNTRDDQVKEFISNLTELSVHVGQGEIAGELDNPENPTRALLEATSAQWEPGAQRFAILVTDADFYSPDKTPANKHDAQVFPKHQSHPETVAPHLSEVDQALKTTGLHVFTVTPEASGYNSALTTPSGETVPDITSASGGEYFEFSQVLHGQISLDSIFDRILRRIDTTYKISYTVDKIQGLDPSLPVAKRAIKISTPAGEVTAQSPISSIPTGRPQYQQAWKVSDQAIQPGSLQVFVNDRLIGAGEYNVSGSQVNFKTVPQPGAKLRFTYLYDAIEKNLRLEPMNIPAATDSRTTKVTLNGKEARPEDIRFDRTAEGTTNLTLNPSATAANDPYDIRRNQGVRIHVITNFTL